jgi:putative ABC transport system permease protein
MSERAAGGLSRALALTRENVRFAFVAVRANRLRSFLTLVGIVIGVTVVITMVAVVDGFKAGLVQNMTSFGATLVQFQKFEPRFGGGRERSEAERNRRDLTVEDAIAIKELCPSIAAVSPERYLFPFPEPVTVRAGGREAQGPVIAGVYPDYMMANNHFVDEGRFFTDADVQHATLTTIIGRDVSEALFPGRDALGRAIDIGGRRYTVIGLFEHKGEAFGGSNDDFVMIPLSSFDKQFPWVSKGGDTIHIATIPRRPEWVNRAVDEGTAVLRARRGLRPDQPNDFAIYTPDKLIEQMESILSGVAFVMIFIASVSLLVGGVGVMNIMLVAVTERTREIGVRMAIGARRRDVVLQFLAEAATLTGCGGLLGIGLGVGIVTLLRVSKILPAVAAPWAIGLGFAVSVSIGLFFGLYPAIKASRLDPIEALRYE